MNAGGRGRAGAGGGSRPIFPDSRHYLEVFNKEEIVYLSADADNTLEKVDPAKVYVIGGIVDRNRYPGAPLLCLPF